MVSMCLFHQLSYQWQKRPQTPRSCVPVLGDKITGTLCITVVKSTHTESTI